MRRSRVAVVGAFLLSIAGRAFAYRVSAWIAPWSQSALTSIQLNAGALAESNPVWYSWNADATIAKNWNAENPTWRAAMTGTALVPTIQNIVDKSFSATAVQTMLATEAGREAHAAALFQLVTSNAFDGIDVDYERVPASARASFTRFVQSLAAKLHGAGKTLSVTVYAKASEVTWNGAGAEDWVAIGAAADSVKIMAYDYHWSSSEAGPLTPLDWLDRVAAYAESTIPRSKIIIALPWYGYDWSATGGTGVSFASATQVALNNAVAIGRDANGEATYAYAGHTVFFQDATSYAKKVDVIRQKHGGIAGFAHWHAGVEDPAIWSVIHGLNAPAALPLPADFTIGGPTSLTVKQGSEVAADYRLTPINGFTGTAAVSVIAPAAFDGAVVPSAPTVAASSSIALRVATTPRTAPGVYQVTLRFASGTLVRDDVIAVVVTGAGRRHAVSR